MACNAVLVANKDSNLLCLAAYRLAENEGLEDLSHMKYSCFLPLHY